MNVTPFGSKRFAEISTIVPVYNESENIVELFGRIKLVLEKVSDDWEIIFVDDGSVDQSVETIKGLRRSDQRVKLIDFSRNFGKEVALSAGLRYSTGKAAILIDCDLQHPPEVIEKMVQKWKEGAEIVFGVRDSRDDESFLKRTFTVVFYSILEKIASIKNCQKIGDFCLLDRKVVDTLNSLLESNRFFKGLINWVGYRQDYVNYAVAKRRLGRSKYNFFKLWNFAIEGITSFSSLPLKVWTYIGIVISLLSITYAIIIIARTFYFGIDVPGYASLIVSILFLGGVQIFSIGVVGEYIGRIYTEVKGRPLYIIRGLYGCSDDMDRANESKTKKAYGDATN